MIKARFKTRKERKVQYLSADGKWKSTGCDTLIEAKKWYYENIEHKVNSLFSNFADGMFTDREVGSYYWVSHKTNKGRTVEWWYVRDNILNNYIMPVFGSFMLDEISTPIIQDWYFNLKGLTKGDRISDSTRNLYLSTLSLIMSWAKNRGLIQSNPCDGVIKIVPRQEGRNRFSPEEMERMFPEDKDKCIAVWGSLQWACLFLVMRDTGWRPGEVAGLDISGFYPELGGVFTKQSVDSFTRKVKQSIKTSGDGYNYKIGMLTPFTIYMMSLLAEIRGKEKGLMFIGDDGDVCTSHKMRRVFKSRMDMLGIDTTGRPPYSIRTTFMTQMSIKYDEDTIKELMGHTQWHRCYDKRTPEELLSKLSRKMG